MSFLSVRELSLTLERTPGLIPVGVDGPNSVVEWLDLGEFHCYQGFFGDGLKLYRALRRDEPAAFRASIDSLLSAGPAPDAIPPTGFIFHAGRCGSTLLTKAIARSRRNLVFGEAAAHNQIWTAPVLEDSGGLEAYRTLLTAMGRRRLRSYGNHIIKFTSYNVMRLSFIRRTFPNVPALFLFREPKRLLESYHRERAPWMGRRTAVGKLWNTPEAAVEDFFRAAAGTEDDRFRVFDYADLSVASLPRILRFLGAGDSAPDLRRMESEFLFDAKSTVPRPFAPRPALGSDRQTPISASLAALYGQLTERARREWSP